MARMNGRQWLVVVGVPVLIGGLGFLLGEVDQRYVLPTLITLMGIFLAGLLVEARGLSIRLFGRTLVDNRATFSQVEALIGLFWVLKPTAPLPATRGWASSPDLLREIADHILREKPAHVVEASSGVSTVIIGLCLQQLGRGKVVSLEHEPTYAERTRNMVRQLGLDDFVSVVHAPLVEHRINGVVHRWYDHRRADLPARIELLVVDGPPESVQDQARYPAVPLLRDRFAAGSRVLMDDGSRAHESRIAERWKQENPTAQLEFLPLEAGAWSLRFV